MADRHDTRYKRLFSHPELVREVLESFVHEDFVKQLDYSQMTRLDKSFVDDRYRKKESDLIWKIPLAGEPFYLYLLLEFQSTVDRFLSLRMLHYLCEFYDYVRSTTRPRLVHLPPVFPLLIYNGERPWTAPVELRELIHPQIAPEYLPSFRYYPLIENEIDDEELLGIRNAVASIFYLEKSAPEKMIARLQELGRLLGGISHPLRELLQGWFFDYLQYLPDGERNCSILEESLPKQRSANMLETAIKGYVKIEREKAIAEGLAEGRMKGQAEGAANALQATLLRLLERRFGITEEARARVASCADVARLNAALDALLDAEDAATVLCRLGE